MVDPAGLTMPAKAAVRQAALARRATQNSQTAGADLAAQVLRHCPPPACAIVAGYWPLPGEIDILLLLEALARDFTICLPVTPPRGQALNFRRWYPGAPMAPGRFNTRHPTGEPLVPSYILAPLLAFDAHGHRLGYGGGYYDRTFAALPGAFRLGCGFSVQEFDDIPAGPTDVTLHAVATERAVRRF